MQKRLQLVLMAVVWLAFAGTASAIDLLNGDLKLSGFAWSQWSVATDGGLHKDRPFSAGFDQGDLAWNRWTLQLEGDYKLAKEMTGFKNIGVYAIGRYWRNTETEISNAIPSAGDFGRGRGGIRTFNGEKYFENLTLREIYGYAELPTLPGGSGFLSVGRQQVIWGESDGFRLADVINPLDLSWHFFLESFEDIRTTIPLARVFYYPDAVKAYNGRLELVWIFGDHESTDFAPVYCGINGIPAGAGACGPGVEGAYWNFGFDQRTIGVGAPGSTSRDNRPRGISGAGEFGARFTISPKNFGPLSDYEISVYDFYTHYDFPTFNVGPTGLQFSYPSQNLIGLTWNRFYEDVFYIWKEANIVFRGEAVYTNKLPITGNAQDGFALKFNDVFKWVIGIDRSTDLPWWGGDFGKLLGISPPGRTSFLAIQWFQTYIANEKQGQTGAETGPRQFPTILTFYGAQRWLTGEELQPAVFIAYEEPQGNILYQPSLTYRYGNYWNFTLTYNMFESFSKGKRRDGFFGPFLQRDELVGKVSFSF